MTTQIKKLRKEFTIADILRLKPKWFFDMQGGESDQELARQNLEYIHTMLEYGLGHLANEPYLAVFGGFGLDYEAKDRGEINRCMATYTKRNDAAAPQVPYLVPKLTKLGLVRPEMLRQALTPNRNEIQNELNQTQSFLRSIPNNIRDYQQQINHYRNEIDRMMRTKQVSETKERALQLLLESESGNIDAEKLRLLKSIPDAWIVANLDTTGFTLIRRVPITMNYVGTAASGMAKSIYLGFIGIQFDWSLNTLASYQVADCIRYADSNDLSCHPHVSGGHICWGNMSARAERFREDKDYPAFFSLFESLLTTYCPENPYVSFDTMYQRRHSHYRVEAEAFRVKLTATKRREILLELAKYGSEEFRKKLPELLKERYAALEPKAGADGLQKMQKRIETIRNLLRIEDKRNKINAIIAEHGPLTGEPLNNALKSVGIHLPTQFELLEKGLRVHVDEFHSEPMKLMLAVYGFVPYFYHTSALRYMHFFSNPMHHRVYLHALGVTPSGGIVMKWNVDAVRGEESQREYSNITLSLNYDSMISELKELIPEHLRALATAGKKMEGPTIEWLTMPPTYTSTNASAPMTIPLGWGVAQTEIAAHDIEEVVEESTGNEVDDSFTEEEEEEESEYEEGRSDADICRDDGHDWNSSDGTCDRCGYECEHDRYSSDGTCVECGYYNSDYDNDRDDD